MAFTPRIKGPEKWFAAGSPDYAAMGVAKHSKPEWEAYDTLLRRFMDMRVQRNWWILAAVLLAATLAGMVFYTTVFRSNLIVVKEDGED